MQSIQAAQEAQLSEEEAYEKLILEQEHIPDVCRKCVNVLQLFH